MASEVGIHEAKTQLSRLLRRVAAGEEIVIKRGSEPVARLVPIHRGGERELGFDRNRIEIRDDFDAPLPDETLDSFES